MDDDNDDDDGSGNGCGGSGDNGDNDDDDNDNDDDNNNNSYDDVDDNDNYDDDYAVDVESGVVGVHSPIQCLDSIQHLSSSLSWFEGFFVSFLDCSPPQHNNESVS